MRTLAFILIVIFGTSLVARADNLKSLDNNARINKAATPVAVADSSNTLGYKMPAHSIPNTISDNYNPKLLKPKLSYKELFFKFLHHRCPLH
jgi:hypothetical protein